MNNRHKNKFKINDMHDYNNRINHAMLKRNISQTQLAKSISISQPEISNYCRGKFYPRPIVSQRIAKVLFCSYKWLNYNLGTANFEMIFYPLDEFWTTTVDRLSYIVWSNNLSEGTKYGN